MGWTIEQKNTSREKIINSAAQLFTKNGFDNVAINDVMKHAGLTRGAFYNHFTSKSELYAEAIVSAAHLAKAHTIERSGFKFADIIETYLSDKHRQGEFSCPLAFLTTDIHQRDDNVRATYTRVLKGFINNMHTLNETEKTLTENEAMRKAVMMIGGLAIARAVNEDDFAERLLNACREGVNA
ncbi:TetR/AcrR family transcriptional regulator [Neptuniibacter sp. 2_MG-2023]|uniref:TetR/AcrR family transcriptional regulator n=1 Tax=Neptuniibacter sp. 2_MG-2023 TaxID=3062671 RepID=UPI0026E2ABCE|nr:TetR/AcrR family transcriptional regulator [Neptuniibacter sp. 2_MG-2023]MDO6513259.1 TetR/AcrR family transcriptional regulator [Neptuniibacter sp. 2_MG-2023]